MPDLGNGTLELPPPPRKDDVLFRIDRVNWVDNACIDVSGRYSLYCEGYRDAAERLLTHVLETRGSQDFLVYPIIFLYRHHIELALKRIIRRSPRLLQRPLTSKEEKHLGKHRLDLLWQDLKPMFAEICVAAGWSEGVDAEDIQGVDSYIKQLTQVDPDSFSFRYEQSKAGDPSLPKTLTHINLRHFAEMMRRLASYIDGIDSAASVVEEWHNDMLADYGHGDY